ncbi:2-isopropylmalate synthase [Alicyclobacillus fastidiosus]|uniref:2-isopropylmalate synthase n=1 Tax=Alicyclobacillus fastidiosus TaxID=392011 RepID=A0ABV5A9D0_9BACL|nr:2-isopropylmalate synthase [Alicyclobacillus fastidiosus]WEH12008.1 2-isopropylmalate synthase [Alicyclobacillus fastidiosus]
MRKLDVFDTTLRDGEQSAGVNLHGSEKLEIAIQLERFGVDIMEAGFPASSPGDFKAVQEIASRIKDCSVAGLARATKSDIDAAWDALRHAALPRLHLFIATSPIHMEHKLRKSPDEVVDTAVDCVRYAASLFPVVQWSAEDATRSDWDFLVRIISKVIDAGAKVINLPDTVGYTTPSEYVRLFEYIRANVPNLGDVKLSAHCHDDLGLAVANSLAVIQAGVEQIEGTINGIGERAGNAALEEILVALAIRKDVYGRSTRTQLTETALTSKLVAKLTGMAVPANKAVVGNNAFAHESGIHQDGVLKNALTYEIIRPEMVGLHSNRMVLGKHSGRHAFKEKCEELNLQLGEQQFNRLFAAFKTLTETKKEITDDDILALVLESSIEDHKYDLEFLHVSYGLNETTAAMGVRGPSGGIQREAATGNGSVEAIFNCLDRVVDGPVQLVDYRIQSTTGGGDALAEVYVKVAYHERVVTGRGVHSDVLSASARAFLDAINRVLIKERLDDVQLAVSAQA